MNSINENEQIKGKPLGVVIIVILTAFFGVFHLVWSSAFIISLLAFAAIYGFWTYQKWGYNLMIIVYILQIIVFGYMGYNEIAAQVKDTRVKGLFVGLFVGILIDGPVIYYLFTDRIKKIFDK